MTDTRTTEYGYDEAMRDRDEVESAMREGHLAISNLDAIADYLGTLTSRLEALEAEHEAVRPLLEWNGTHEGLFEEMLSHVIEDDISSPLLNRYLSAFRLTLAAHDHAERVMKP